MASGLGQPVEIVRDRWGVPHIFAASDEDAAFALGYCHAQDRLFQMELSRRASQGRLSELLGPGFVKTDTLFRTVDLFGPGRPDARERAPRGPGGLRGLREGRERERRRPRRPGCLRSSRSCGTGFAPAKADDFVGILGFMTWGLNQAWTFDPLFEKLVAKVGAGAGGRAVPLRPRRPPFGPPRGRGPQAEPLPALSGRGGAARLPALAPRQQQLGGGPARRAPPAMPSSPTIPTSATACPASGTRHTSVTPTQDVVGVTMPGLPFVVHRPQPRHRVGLHERHARRGRLLRRDPAPGDGRGDEPGPMGEARDSRGGDQGEGRRRRLP